MACYLVVSLAAVAGLFFLAGADFLGAVQLMVYVGGTMVLLVFGVMLTARGPFVSMKTGGGQWILAVDHRRGAAGRAAAGGAAASGADAAATAAGGRRRRRSAAHGHAAGPGTDGRPRRPARPSGRSGAARPACPAICWPFEIISVHLVVVLVGAAYLARAKRRRRCRNRGRRHIGDPPTPIPEPSLEALTIDNL